ncbi:TadE/TadG family type IV pilus assembly protein [Massilia sp. IC2-278]|uniref:TadE/TadG family type IV pilus assembly protein n=1 Tax=Massilia sp. IC2-278 TaxID=2887200 RepID=UPI001E504087
MAAVEFALVAIIFFTLIFGVLEIARALYICNTLQEVTRRAAELAAKTDFSDAAAMQRVREVAIFRNSPGYLAFGEPVSDINVRIDYLPVTRDSAVLPTVPIQALPANPLENQAICMNDPNDARCIRLVRVRICQAGGPDQCDPVSYQSIVSLTPFSFNLPTSTTIVVAETLGRPAGLPPG